MKNKQKRVDEFNETTNKIFPAVTRLRIIQSLLNDYSKGKLEGLIDAKTIHKIDTEKELELLKLEKYGAFVYDDKKQIIPTGAYYFFVYHGGIIKSYKPTHASIIDNDVIYHYYVRLWSVDDMLIDSVSYELQINTNKPLKTVSITEYINNYKY